MSFAIQEKVVANAIVLKDVELCDVVDEHTKRNLRRHLKSRQDALEAESLRVGAAAASTNPSVRKKVIDNLFTRYLEHDVDPRVRFKRKALLERNHTQPELISDFEEQMQISKADHTEPNESIDALQKDLDFYQHRTASLESANQNLEYQYRGMKDHYTRTLEDRDREHADALADAQAQLKEVQSERAVLQFDNEALKSQLTETVGKWAGVSNYVDLAGQLVLELRAAQNRIAQLTNAATFSTGAVTPAATLSASEDDEDAPTTAVPAEEEENEAKEDDKHDDDDEEHETVRSSSAYLSSCHRRT